MTAAIQAGDTLLTGSAGKVHATAADDGRELWSAPVPGTVSDLAFHSGRLLATTRQGGVICFSRRGR
jgi:outer membrane protein assembly factor BamB